MQKTESERKAALAQVLGLGLAMGVDLSSVLPQPKVVAPPTEADMQRLAAAEAKRSRRALRNRGPNK